MITVFIVEDDPSFVKILERRLKGIFDDVTIKICSTLESARKELNGSAISYSLVLLDQHLPDGSGVSLLEEGFFEGMAVVAMSAESTPEMAGRNVTAGASYFLPKESVMEPLFVPLIKGILDRNELQKESLQLKLKVNQIETVKTLVSTLRHEVNNPLGAVLGATYILSTSKDLSQEQADAIKLLEASSHRIKHVLEELCQAVQLDVVNKSTQKVFQIPGDKPWE